MEIMSTKHLHDSSFWQHYHHSGETLLLQDCGWWPLDHPKCHPTRSAMYCYQTNTTKLTDGFSFASCWCAWLTSPISSMVCGRTERASFPFTRNWSMAERLIWMERRREVRRASNSCWMWSSTEALTGRVDTVMQSTRITKRERRDGGKV